VWSGRPGEEAGRAANPAAENKPAVAMCLLQATVFLKEGISVRRWRRTFRNLSVAAGILSLLVTLGLICVALIWGMMLSGRPDEIIIATWMALGLTKYLFNALLVIFSFFTFNSKAASQNYLVFLIPSVLLMIWNLAAFPHKLAYGYFIFWAVYSVFLVLNREMDDDSVQPGQITAEAACRQGK